MPPLERALHAFPDAYARDKALYLLALAEAYLYGHELELAAPSIRQAHRLTSTVASTRPGLWLKQTLALTTEVATAKPIRDLHTELDATRYDYPATDCRAHATHSADAATTATAVICGFFHG